MLARMLERVRGVRYAHEIVVATTEAAADDGIVDIARAAGLACVRGHATDLLECHLAAARAHDADVVVKVPSDCPVIDPQVIDSVIGSFVDAAQLDYVSNLHPASWPDGFDVEVMTRDALERAHREATRPYEREHTTPYLWTHPELFAVDNVRWEVDLSRTYRLTLDYFEDYLVIRAIYEALWSPTRIFTLADVLRLLAARPELAEHNAAYLGTSWMDRHRGELHPEVLR
jgi:spore coat polysaccharide biosynthesis protein SpsF